MSELRVVVDEKSLGETLFRPHGTYAAQVDGSLLRSAVTGPINLQWVQAYGDKVLPLYTTANAQGPFAVLTLFSESMMVNMDAVECFADTVRGFKAQFPNWRGVAFIGPRGIEGRGVMDYLFASKCYGPIGVAYRLFDNEADGEAWLRGEVLVG